MPKEKQKIFSKYYLSQMIEDVEGGNLAPYLKKDKFKYLEKYPPGDSLIEISPSFTLKDPKSLTENYDIDNSISLYKEFNSLTETQASDPRLWTYLSHVTFWDYMLKRWPAEKFADDEHDDEYTESQTNFIIWRYHLKNSNTRRLLRHGISRLWWYSHLTFDPARKDNFELTRVLLSNLDIAQTLLERTLGRNRKLLITLLEFIQENPDLKRLDIRDKIKEINLAGGVKNLQLLSTDEIKMIIS